MERTQLAPHEHERVVEQIGCVPPFTGDQNRRPSTSKFCRRSTPTKLLPCVLCYSDRSLSFKLLPLPFNGRIVDVPVMMQLHATHIQTGEDGGSLARAVRQQSRESTCDHADQPGDQARRNPTDLAHRQGTRCPSTNQVTKHVVTPPPVAMPRHVPQVQSGANGRGPRKRPTKAEYAAMRKAEAMLGIWPSLLTPPRNE